MKNGTKTRRNRLVKAVGAYCSALAIGGMLSPGQVAAQETGLAVEAGEQSTAKLEEVRVTARRRSEEISRVPISISALSADQILNWSIRTDSDLQSAVPGLTIRQTQGNNSLTYSIRGQSADTFSGSPSAVVTYLDEVPVTVNGASTLYDLESIQVLKGPQGTLFGRNTTGGAVLYTTAKPTNEFDAMLRLRGGNYNLQEAEGMLNVPLMKDTLLMRVAFDTLDRDGYIHNQLNGDDLGDVDRDSGRIALTARPGEHLENTTVYSYTKTHGTNTGASYTYSVYGCGETNNGYPLNCSAGYLYGPSMDDAFGFEGAWAGYLEAHPEAYAPGLIAYVDEQKRLGYYDTRHPGGARHKGTDWQLSNTTTYEFAEDLRLKNILGWSHSKTDSEQPQLGAPFITILTANVDTGKSGNELEIDSFSEELQLSGEAMNGGLVYIAGVFLQNLKSDTLWPQTYFDLLPWAPPTTATNNFRIKDDTQAVYAQATYDLSKLTRVDGLRVTAGARYTWIDSKIEQLSQADAFGAPDQDQSFSDPSWEFGFEYDATDAVFTYLKYRGSFRSGGYNGSAPPVDSDATGGGNKFKSETTEDVEGGLKFRGSVFDRPASLDIAIYKQWVNDVQRVEFPDPDGPEGPIASIAVTANVPKMEVDGIELQATILPVDWLELGISGAYTDADFTDGNVQLFGTSYSYSPVANTPKRSGLAWLNIPVSFEGLGDMSLHVEYFAQSSMYFSNTGNSIGPDTKLPSYELVNARLDWNGILGSDFSAAVFGRNLADEHYFVGGMALGSSLGHNAAAVGQPRTYGAELTYEF